jgi:hypothetical protein
MRAERYRRYAAECLSFARGMTSPASRAVLLDMAQSWITLADAAEKNAKAELVFEPPARA